MPPTKRAYCQTCGSQSTYIKNRIPGDPLDFSCHDYWCDDDWHDIEND